MSEDINTTEDHGSDSAKMKRVVATAAAIAAAGIGVASADAAPAVTKPANADMTQPFKPEAMQTLESVQLSAQEKLMQGKDLNYYRGTVVLEFPDGTSKTLLSPVIGYKYGGQTPQQAKFALNHPNSKYWTVGYIEIEAGKAENPDPVIVMYDLGRSDVKAKFFRHDGKPGETNRDTAPTVDAVHFPIENGKPNIDMPLNVGNQPITEAASGMNYRIGEVMQAGYK